MTSTDLIKSLRDMAEMPLEGDTSDPLIEVIHSLGAQAADLITAQKKLIAELKIQKREMGEVIDMRWEADRRAISRWQAAEPERELVWPDHADLVVWLLGERDRLITMTREIGPLVDQFFAEKPLPASLTPFQGTLMREGVWGFVSWLTKKPEFIPYQRRVNSWMQACFGPKISADIEERNHRFIEEALELVQANGCTAHECHQLVDYVFGRPVGEVQQEIGGVMVTLAALCTAIGQDMAECGEIELKRIWTKVEQIRAKQAAKPKHSPLPEAAR